MTAFVYSWRYKLDDAPDLNTYLQATWPGLALLIFQSFPSLPLESSIELLIFYLCAQQ